MSELLGHFHFLRPLWLLALVPAALIGWLLWRQRDPLRSYRTNIAPHLLTHLVIKAGKRSLLRPEVVLLCILPLSILALAGPSWRQEPSPFAEDQAAAIVVLKIAPSMQASDLQPSRLERAQHKLHDWLALRPGARVGLIAYSGSAHLVMPLTRDSRIVEQMAQALEPSVMPVQGDALKRSISLRAAAISGMAFEPVQYAPVSGIGIYPSAPVVQDAVDRGSLVEGRRTESVTYVFEQEGHYALPDVTVTWWDLEEKRLHREVLPGPHARVVLAGPVPTSGDGASAPAAHAWPQWLGIVAAVGVAAVGAWLYWRQAIRARYQAWTLARDHNEAAYFRRFTAAARTSDVHRTLNTLLRWLDRLEAGTAPAQLGPFVQRYGDEALRHEAQRLERLVATGSQEAWDATPLLHGMTQARQLCLHAGRQQSARHTIVPPLNPCSAEELG
jgi:von Willebrand factor type A domain